MHVFIGHLSNTGPSKIYRVTAPGSFVEGKLDCILRRHYQLKHENEVME